MICNYQATYKYILCYTDWHNLESFIADLKFIRCVTATHYMYVRYNF